MKKKLENILTILSFIGYSILLSLFVSSCSSPASSPEVLAKECCDCYKEMESLKNTDGRERKLVECMDLQTNNQRQLHEICITNDLTEEQVKDMWKRFDNVLDNCPN